MPTAIRWQALFFTPITLNVLGVVMGGKISHKHSKTLHTDRMHLNPDRIYINTVSIYVNDDGM